MLLNNNAVGICIWRTTAITIRMAGEPFCVFVCVCVGSDRIFVDSETTISNPSDSDRLQPAINPLRRCRSARTLAIMSRGNNNVLCWCAKDVRTLQTPNHYSTARRRHRQQNHGRTSQAWRGEMNIPKNIYVYVCAHLRPQSASSSSQQPYTLHAREAIREAHNSHKHFSQRLE